MDESASDGSGSDGSESDGHEQREQGAEEEGCGGTPVPRSTWIVDYEGDGNYCVRRRTEGGAVDEVLRPDMKGWSWHMHPELTALVFGLQRASPGDTVVFAPAVALIHALERRRSLQELLDRVSKRMPRRKHFPFPIWHSEDGVGLVRGEFHSDQFSAVMSLLSINGFHLGLRGSHCAGTKRRWEWVEPEERRGGGGAEN